MDSQQMEAQRSGESIFNLLLLPQALRAAGMTEEVMKALITTPSIARAAARAATHALRFAQKGAYALDTPLHKTHLPKREFNTLRRAGIETLGELALCNELELQLIRNIGSKAIEAIAETLDAYGIVLVDMPGDELNRALALYDGGDFIPAVTMRLWVTRLDTISLRYLRQRDTLGDLSTKSWDEFRDEFIRWRKANVPDEPLHETSLAQAELVKSGLTQAGLCFFEP